MAFDRTLLRNPYWWIEAVGVALQFAAMFVVRTGELRLVLLLLGLGLFVFGAKAVYDQRQELKNRGYEPFPKNRTARTR